MKKILITVATIAMLTGCNNISPEQREKIVDLVIAGIGVAEQVYLADQQTPKKEDYVLTNTDSNPEIAYQLTLAYKLLKQDGKQYAMPDTGQTYELTLKHFVVKLLEYQTKGQTTTKLRIKRATVEKGVITDLMYSLEQEDGSKIEEQCPDCVLDLE